MIRAMSTENWLDFIAISMDPRKADGMTFVINLVTPDNGEKYLVEMSNATLTNIKGEQAKKPDLTITINRADLNTVMMGAEHVRRPDQGRQGEIRRRPQGLRSAQGHPRLVRTEFRDPAGNCCEGAVQGVEAVRDARSGAAGRGGRLTAPRSTGRIPDFLQVTKSGCGPYSLESTTQ